MQVGCHKERVWLLITVDLSSVQCCTIYKYNHFESLHLEKFNLNVCWFSFLAFVNRLRVNRLVAPSKPSTCRTTAVKSRLVQT